MTSVTNVTSRDAARVICGGHVLKVFLQERDAHHQQQDNHRQNQDQRSTGIEAARHIGFEPSRGHALNLTGCYDKRKECRMQAPDDFNPPRRPGR